MGLKVKIDPVERVTAAKVRSDLTLPEQRQAAAEFVRAGVAEADSINRRILGRVPPRTITVDGQPGDLNSVSRVNPDGGTVIVEYELVTELLRWIGQELVQRSPVLSGAYMQGHTLLADGREVSPGGQIPVAEEYVFLNPVPYARKIEIGKTNSGRSFVIQVPNRIYERTAKDARSRFGNQADIAFGYRAAGGYTLRRGVGKRKDRQRGSVVQSPAIIVRHKR